MSLEPEAGLVISYDFLWKEDQQEGADYGSKDRPCAIIFTITAEDEGGHRVVVCPITHSPPSDDQSAVEISPRIAAHLGLDGDKMWIKTDAVNVLTWSKDMIPIGVMPVEKGKWSYGMLPDKISEEVINQVRENSRNRTLDQVERDDQ
jgi:hypothetical protein